MSMLLTPVSYGEVLDKITILEIKSQHIDDKEKLKNVQIELDILIHTWNKNVENTNNIIELKIKLKVINHTIWDIEDSIRLKEKGKEFDEEFIQTARSVYFQNDQRAAIKKQINLLLGSKLVEEKSYQDYS